MIRSNNASKHLKKSFAIKNQIERNPAGRNPIMKTKRALIRNTAFLLSWLLLSTFNFQLSTLLAQGTAFTYQGRLNDGAGPASGIYDLRFAIYDLLTGGTQQ